MYKSLKKSVNEVTVPEVTVLTVEMCATTEAAKLMCAATIAAPTTAQACTVKLLVDTGAGVSILPENVFSEYFGSSKLSEPKVQLVTYFREKLNVLGCFKADVTYYEKSVPTDFYIVKTGTSILGMDLVNALQLQIKGGQLIHETATVCATLHIH